MSRIGKNPVVIPQGVEVQVNGQELKVKGKLGELTLDVHNEVALALEDGESGKIVRLSPRSDSPMAKMIWPTMRNLANNMVIGVSQGYKKRLEIKGVGYRAELKGSTLVMALGFSHDVRVDVPKGIKITMDGQTAMEISGIDKQQVGQIAADIRGYKPPEPYKGKGIRYADEVIVRKEGKKK